MLYITHVPITFCGVYLTLFFVASMQQIQQYNSLHCWVTLLETATHLDVTF